MAPDLSTRLTADLKGTNIYLVGMMGTGKTTVGKQLAQQLGYRFLDTDELIEQAAGQPIPDIFAESGEAGFRALETQVLSQVSAYTRLVIATGGGIVIEQMNWSYLQYGVVVWLDVPVPELMNRLRGDRSRPLLQDTDLKDRLETLWQQRANRYRQADVQVQAVGGVGAIAAQVLEAIGAVVKSDRAGVREASP
ncbi:shikimate kinase [Romeria aff. gracilis LEGE 07310]|uniref:Shikimate kinase n=1 Tax=Vasconcelosia minhoensis LEGE 07310 TaxID=915328 RepID=A0A8J7DF65_9CYAN|nr:shikimate kinase [Romeria gracilis]MBE9080498.1 shikimate kinase [Romeria aff. gracilis LEGE 07310]